MQIGNDHAGIIDICGRMSVSTYNRVCKLIINYEKLDIHNPESIS